MNPVTVLAVLCGGLAGLGVLLVVRGLLPAAPALGPALDRLHNPAALAPPTAESGPLGRWLLAHLGDRLRPPHTELRLIGQSTEKYVLEKVGYALVGLAFPPLVTLMLAMFGLRLPFAVPAVACLGLAVLMYLLVDVSVRQKAAEAREEFTRAVSVYLNLVALERSASHGPTESLERAARVGTGWVFDRIRAALAAARFAGDPPWDGLSRVADEIGVPELGDVGNIMRLSGVEGAQVYQNLVALSQALRVALRTKEADRANTATTLLYIPTSLTVLVLFILAGYPFLIRLITT
jgi:tight adherence protein C